MELVIPITSIRGLHGRIEHQNLLTFLPGVKLARKGKRKGTRESFFYACAAVLFGLNRAR